MRLRGPRSQRLGPGLMRMPVAGAGPAGGASGGLPLSLTLDIPEEKHPVGVLAPAPRPAWGCLFFSILGIGILLAIGSLHWAFIWAGLALVAFWSFFNHPSRQTADSARAAAALMLEGEVKRAWMALEPALRRAGTSDGIHYLAGMISLGAGRPDRALDHLDKARPAMQAYAEYHHLLGRALEQRGRSEEARAAFERAWAFPAYPARAHVQEELAALDGSAPEAAE